MALTIHDTPVNYTPSGNPVVWTFSSDQTAQANFSYLVEVYVGGTLRGRQQIFTGNGNLWAYRRKRLRGTLYFSADLI